MKEIIFNTKNNVIEIRNKTNFIDITLIREDIIRITNNLSYKSYSVFLRKRKIKYQIIEDINSIIIKTSKINVVIDSDLNVDFYDLNMLPISLTYRGVIDKTRVVSSDIASLEGHKANQSEVDNLKFCIYRMIKSNEYFYGLGDKTGFLNKRDYEYVNWNTDDPSVHADNYQALYKSIPFIISHSKDNNYGFFLDNTYKSIFNLGKENKKYLFFGAVDGDINYYFIGGSNIKEIVSNYTLLTGRYPLPQLWTLGHHQSRWSYESEKRVYEIIDNYQKHNIGLDVIHLDIDYMERYKVFSINNESFPNFKEMVSDLKKKGIRVVCIVDPGIKQEALYNVYEEGVKNNYFATLNNELYVNAVWPGDSVFPNFNKTIVRNWWSDLVTFLTDLGVAGIWTDMNEPASFKGKLPYDVEFDGDKKKQYHKEIHNVYGSLMAEATYNGLKKTGLRPFVITRACFAGAQKYTTAWTGDNHSIWAHLQMAIPQLCNLGLSGMPFVGTDVGGFGGDCTKELLARWVEVGCLSPLFRNHSSIGTRNQEPWQFDEELIGIYKKFVNLRYELLPYIYDEFHIHYKYGYPVFRPIVFNYPDDERTFEINDEFMIGDNLLVAPIVNQGENERLVYFPKGKWYNFFTNEKIIGGRSLVIKAKLDELPLYVKDKTIIPTFNTTNSIDKYDELILKVYGKKAKYKHYQDDYESFDYQNKIYNEYLFTYSKNQIIIDMLNEKYKKYNKIIIKNID